MSPPVASIIVPAFNAASWLTACLESALAQTLPGVEVIVVDDGSADGTWDLLQAYVGKGVRIFRQENAGAAAARNRGLREARGALIQFLDADDLLDPDKLRVQAAALAGRPFVLASGRWGRFAASPSDAVFNDEALYHARSGVEHLQIQFETTSMIQPGAWLCHRDLLEKAGPWAEDLSLNDDGENFARVALAASNLVHVPDALSFYRDPAGWGLSRRRDPAALFSLFLSTELMTTHLLQADGSPRSRKAAAWAWQRTAYELHPEGEDLSHQAEAAARARGVPLPPLPGGPVTRVLCTLFGWRRARAWQVRYRRGLARPGRRKEGHA